MVPLTDISIYDIASASWYSVTATGIPPAAAIPEPRGAMCTIVSASPDNSSFQITMYGGWNPEAVGGGVDYEDVWVLTVPSFRWIKIDTVNDFQANPSLSVGRAHHRCVVHRGQMISVGGSLRFGTQGQVNETMCRGSYPPLRVLDLGTVSWVKTFNTEGVYRVPRVVSEVIGGGAEGGATLTEPEGGWAYTELKSIMALRNAANNASAPATASSGTSSATSSSDASSSSGGSNTGAIAGGVVGGVVGLALIAGLIFFFGRRKTSRAKQNEVDKSEKEVWLGHDGPGNDRERERHELEAKHRAELEAHQRRAELEGEAGGRYELSARKDGR